MPEELEEFLLVYPGFGARPTTCHVLVAAGVGVVLGELDDNDGTSLTNSLELASAALADLRFDGHADFRVFEYLPVDIVTRKSEMLEIRWSAPGLRMPEWLAPVEVPDWVVAAQERIIASQPYTQATLMERGLPTVDGGGARHALELIRAARP